MELRPLLERLADGEFHSGQALGDSLGVSRTAVWKALGQLPDLGIEVESASGRGYRIPGGLDLLDESVIRAGLSDPARAAIDRLDVYGSVDSTNRIAMEMAELHPDQAFLCLAEFQSAGRGRRGRSWFSPYGGSLYLSLTYESPGGLAELEGLSLAVGVAACRALRRSGVTGVELKWPNDLIAKDGKLAGILVEVAGEADGPCQAIIGIGVNVRLPQDAGSSIDQAFTDLRRLGAGQLTRNALAAALINELTVELAQYRQHGFAPLREEWESYHAWQNRPVVVISGDRQRPGVAVGVTSTGALRLRTPEGEDIVNGGEVSLRALR